MALLPSTPGCSPHGRPASKRRQPSARPPTAELRPGGANACARLCKWCASGCAVGCIAGSLASLPPPLLVNSRVRHVVGSRCCATANTTDSSPSPSSHPRRSGLPPNGALAALGRVEDGRAPSLCCPIKGDENFSCGHGGALDASIATEAFGLPRPRYRVRGQLMNRESRSVSRHFCQSVMRVGWFDATRMSISRTLPGWVEHISSPFVSWSAMGDDGIMLPASFSASLHSVSSN